MLHLRLEKFEGPMSLLLKLILDEKLDITQVSLAKVADEYISYIKTHELNPEETADFLVVASKLLLIKSKALLPFLYPEEEQEIEEFTEQLKMYQEFLLATKEVQSLIGQKRFMFERKFNRKALIASTKLFAPPKDYSKLTAKVIFEEIIDRLKPFNQVLEEKTIELKVTIEEKLFAITDGLMKRARVSFSEILNKSGNKTDVIVSFLAMLELVRMQQIGVTQGELFSDIEMFKLVDNIQEF